MIACRSSPCVVRKAAVPYKDGKAHGSRPSTGPRSQPRQSPRVVNGDRGKLPKGKEKKGNAPKHKDDKVGWPRLIFNSSTSFLLHHSHPSLQNEVVGFIHLYLHLMSSYYWHIIFKLLTRNGYKILKGDDTAVSLSFSRLNTLREPHCNPMLLYLISLCLYLLKQNYLPVRPVSSLWVNTGSSESCYSSIVLQLSCCLFLLSHIRLHRCCVSLMSVISPNSPAPEQTWGIWAGGEEVRQRRRRHRSDWSIGARHHLTKPQCQVVCSSTLFSLLYS